MIGKIIVIYTFRNLQKSGILPVLRITKDELKEIIQNNEKLNFSDIESKNQIGYSEHIEIKFGEYPQSYEFNREDIFLNSEYTGKEYRINSKPYKEVIYNGEKYMEYIEHYLDDEVKSPYKVEPVIWRLIKYEDEGEYCLISTKILIAEIKYPNISKTLKNMEEDMFKGSILKEKKDNRINQKELIETALKSDVPIILKGKDEETKIKTIKKYDSNPEIVCLQNIDKESLIGTRIYDNEYKIILDVKPDWLQKAERAYEENPQNIHIIYFDEIDNISEDLKANISNIINKRKVNGKWNLPPNVRIILSTGKENLENKFKEYNNFLTVDIKTTSKDWLEQNKPERVKTIKNINIPVQINPIIYAYIEEKDKNNEDLINKIVSETGVKLNSSTWNLASRLMYVSENPRIIEPLVGSEIAKDFEKFYKKQKEKQSSIEK